MFKTRLLSGIVLVLVALLTICSGGTVLYMTVLCLSLIGAGELFRVMKVREDKWNLLEITGYAGVVIFYLSLLLHDPMYQMLALILDLVLLMAVYVFTYPKYNANQVMPAFFAIVYVGVMLSYVYQHYTDIVLHMHNTCSYLQTCIKKYLYEYNKLDINKK